MALPFLVGGGNANSVKHFQIRLDQKTVVLRGNENDASSALIKGTVVLCLSEALRIKAINLRLTGDLRVGWLAPEQMTPNTYKDSQFLKQTWVFLKPEKRSSEILGPGNHEYAFEHILPGTSPETIEQARYFWCRYSLKATIERGTFQTNVIASERLRVLRVFDSSALELAHGMNVENIWPDKIQYLIGIPTKAAIFGTSVRVDFSIIPLLKGLKIGKVLIDLNETQALHFDTTRQRKHQRFHRCVAKDDWQFPEDVETADIDGQEGFAFSRNVPLPKQLGSSSVKPGRNCLQDVDFQGIKIKHNLSFIVQLINPDEHVSELRAHLPVHIYISPNIPLGSDGMICEHGAQASGADVALDQGGPPMYGEHQYDQLYDCCQSGSITPFDNASGVNTPFYAASQPASTENLSSMNVTTSTPLHPQALQLRLNALGERQDVAATRATGSRLGSWDDTRAVGPETAESRDTLGSDHSSYDWAGRQSQQYNHQNRPLSTDEDPSSGARTPAPMPPYQHVEDLSRVPSYSTALQVPSRTPISAELPTYRAATSRPPSPPPLMPRMHSQVHTAGPVSSTVPARESGLRDSERRFRVMQMGESH